MGEHIQEETTSQKNNPATWESIFLDSILAARAAVYRLTMNKAWAALKLFHHKLTNIKFDLVLSRVLHSKEARGTVT